MLIPIALFYILPILFYIITTLCKLIIIIIISIYSIPFTALSEKVDHMFKSKTSNLELIKQREEEITNDHSIKNEREGFKKCGKHFVYLKRHESICKKKLI